MEKKQRSRKNPTQKKKTSRNIASGVSFDKVLGSCDASTGWTMSLLTTIKKRISTSSKTRILNCSRTLLEKEEGRVLDEMPSSLVDAIKGALLTQVWFTNNHLNSMPPFLKQCRSLTTLCLSGNEISELPESLGEELSSLQKLYLSKNALSALPDSFKNLRQLTHLHLGWNAFTTIPLQITECTALIVLDLQENKITTVPTQLRALKSLIELNVDGNEIGPEVPTAILGLPSLQFLGIANNYVASSPTLLQEMSLIHARVSGNRSPEFAVEDPITGNKKVPLRFDGYLALNSTQQVVNEEGESVRTLVPLPGHMECSRLYTMKNAQWYRSEENDVRSILHLRAKRKTWKTENRLEEIMIPLSAET